LHNKLDFFMIESDAHNSQNENFKINKYPMIYYFDRDTNNSRTYNDAILYDGNRTAEGLIQ